MNLELKLEGSEANEDSALDLQDWLKQERIAGLQVERKSIKPKPGEMGGELVPILSMILGSAAVVELAKSIHVWLKMRKPKLKMKIKSGESEISIDVENLQDQESFVENILNQLRPDED